MKRINAFDLFVLIVISLTMAMFLITWNNKPFLGDSNVVVEIKVTNPEFIKGLNSEVVKSKTVFYSGTKYPVQQISIRKVSDNEVYVALSGRGQIKDGGSIFNGQRIFINQKAEIRADYFVQGYVTDYRYEK